MRIRSGIVRMLALLALGAGVLATSAPRMTRADPLSWAPAQSRYKGHDYTGYNGKKWRRDYGVLEGRCNREAVGAALGGAANGAIGSQAGKRENRQIAVVLGIAAGAVADAPVGRDMDETDRACIGHTLELADDRKRIAWNGADGRKAYLLTPIRGFEQNGAHCREFDLSVTSGGRRETSRAKACPVGDGNWHIVN